MTRLTFACAVALTLAAAPVLAQQAKTVAPVAVPQQAQPAVGSEEWLRQRGESYSAAPDSEQDPAEVEATSKLNTGIAAEAAAAERADAQARADFEAKFSKRDLSSAELPFFRASAPKLSVAKLVQETGAVPSNSEARRLITQGGVKLEGEKLADPKAEISLSAGQILQIGKKTFFRIQL